MKVIKAERQFERFEDITPEILKEEGVKLILCDLDNTLTNKRLMRCPSENVGAWVEACREAGVEIVIVTNNTMKKKVREFCQPFKIHSVCAAKKPLSKHLTATREKLHMKKEETVMLGDKWSTDMVAAKLAGVRAWKVEHRTKLDDLEDNDEEE